jgi:hypothetical protein
VEDGTSGGAFYLGSCDLFKPGHERKRDGKPVEASGAEEKQHLRLL